MTTYQLHVQACEPLSQERVVDAWAVHRVGVARELGADGRGVDVKASRQRGRKVEIQRRLDKGSGLKVPYAPRVNSKVPCAPK